MNSRESEGANEQTEERMAQYSTRRLHGLSTHCAQMPNVSPSEHTFMPIFLMMSLSRRKGRDLAAAASVDAVGQWRIFLCFLSLSLHRAHTSLKWSMEGTMTKVAPWRDLDDASLLFARLHSARCSMIFTKRWVLPEPGKPEDEGVEITTAWRVPRNIL